MQKFLDKSAVLQRLDELRRSDPKRKVFGANVHDYKLQPPLPLSEIELVEKKHAVSFPDDYKTFITQIGNGGAGPYYGLFPFGMYDKVDHFCAWEDGGMVGELSQPFPHAVEWNLPHSFWEKQPNPPSGISLEEEGKLMEAWDKEMEQYYLNPANMNGAIPICHLGCALRQWLVVNGAQRGFVWNDFRADQRGLSPVRDQAGRQMTLTDWYMAWLEKPGRLLAC